MENPLNIFRRDKPIAQPSATAMPPPVAEPTQTLFATSSKTFVETYSFSDFLDEGKLQKETVSLYRDVEKAKESTMQAQIVVKSAQEQARWADYNRKAWDVATLAAAIDDPLREAGKGERSLSHGQVAWIQGQNAGALYLTHDTLTQMIDFSRRHALPGERENNERYIKPYAELLDFMLAGPLHIQVHGLSLIDVLDRRNAVSPADVYRFFLESFLVRHSMAHDRVLRENPPYPMQKYPNLTKSFIENGTAYTNALFHLTKEDFRMRGNGLQGLNGKVFRKTESLVERVSGLKEEIYRTLLSPQMSEFAQLSDAMASYMMRGDRRLALFSLHFAGVNDMKKLAELYRKAKQYHRENIHPEFYGRLETFLQDYVEETPPIYGVLTHDDIETLEDDTVSVPDSPTPTIARVGASVGTIFAKSSQQEYTLDPTAISWGKLVVPESIAVIFDRNRPQKFSVELPYISALGEHQRLHLDFDTKRNYFDWNFIEDPQDPDMASMYKNVMFATQSILRTIQEQAEESYRLRHTTKNFAVASAPQAKRVKPEYVKEPPEEKEKKPKQQVQTPFLMALSETAFQAEQGVKNIIVIEGEERLTEHLGRVSSEDQRRVREAITTYNDQGVGKFYRLTQPSEEGEILYTLRTNSEVRGGIRVLLTESPSQGKTRKFIIKDIGYRKDIYKRNKV